MKFHNLPPLDERIDFLKFLFLPYFLRNKISRYRDSIHNSLLTPRIVSEG